MRMTLVCFMMAFIALGPAGASAQADIQGLKESESTPGYWPRNGLVPDAKTAIAIAVAVWEPIYGKRDIAADAPYEAVLKNDRWIVRGTLAGKNVGGTAFAVIAKRDGRIIKVYHTK
jgi:hypothetical protein